MTRIPIIRSRDTDFVDISNGRNVLNLEYLDVSYDPKGGAQIPIYFGNDHDKFPTTFCMILPPPAAKQLSRALSRAVKDYLKSKPASSSKDHSD